MPHKSQPEKHPPIHVSGVKYPNPVGKRIELSPDGESLEKFPQLSERANTGECLNLRFATAKEAFDYRLNAPPSVMFVCGTFEPDVKDADVVPNAQLVERVNGEKKQVALTKAFLGYHPVPGLISIDIDVKRPDDVEGLFPEAGQPVFETAERALEAFYEILPEAIGSPVCVAPSASSMINRESDGVAMSGHGGLRILLATSDASQTPRILETIHMRCWAREKYNFAFVSKGACTLVRSLADQALARPTQPDYPTADLGSGLEKTAGQSLTKNLDANLFDPSTVDLSDEDRAAALENINKAKIALEPARILARKKAKTREVDRLVERGVDRLEAERAAELKLGKRVVTGSDRVIFADGQEVPVAEILSEQGKEYDGMQCLDPVEPGYDNGRLVGKFYWNEGIAPGIHSFAHGVRFFRLKHDLASCSAAIAAPGASHAEIVRTLALAELRGTEMKVCETQAARKLGLGNSRRVLRAEIQRERFRAEEIILQVASGGANNGASQEPNPLDQPLRNRSFPQYRVGQIGEIVLLDHQDNVAHLLQGYGIEQRYNVITKDMEWKHPQIPHSGDDAENALLSQLHSLAALNGLPDKKLQLHLSALANANPFNPVTDYLSRIKWDREPRLNNLGSLLGLANASESSSIASIALRMFYLQGCASADHAKEAKHKRGDVEAHFETVLVLVGGQGTGKTKGIRKLLPRPLRQYYKVGQVLNLQDKDSVKRAVSCWICELGELEATFRKNDIATKKAFLSQGTDEIRAPYAPKPSRLARRTSFIGTVNDESFLADETGNRRFVPVRVGKLVIELDDEMIDQIWAEAWYRYVGGEQWWPTADEQRLLDVNAEKFRVRTEVEETIERAYQWGEPPESFETRFTASQILKGLSRSTNGFGAEKTLKTVGATVKRLWQDAGLTVDRNGELYIEVKNGEMVKLNAPSGKNRGWLMPPRIGCKLPSIEG